MGFTNDLFDSLCDSNNPAADHSRTPTLRSPPSAQSVYSDGSEELRDLDDAASLARNNNSPSLDARSRGASTASTGSGAACPRHWTPEEDALLRNAVQRVGARQWKVISRHVPGRTHTQCLQRWNKCLKPGLLKGPWSPDEDHLLRSLVEQSLAALQRLAPEDADDDDDDMNLSAADAREALLKRVDWALVSENIRGRSVKQCRERWTSNLDPVIRRDAWTAAEDQTIVEMQAEHGNCWARMSRVLPGRTEHAVKTRFRSILRARRREWAPQEDALLIRTYAALGSQWDAVSAPFAGSRTKNAVMTRFKQLQGVGLVTPSRRPRSVAPRAKMTTADGSEAAPDSYGGSGLLAVPPPPFVQQQQQQQQHFMEPQQQQQQFTQPQQLFAMHHPLQHANMHAPRDHQQQQQRRASRLRAFDSMADVEECALHMLSASAAAPASSAPEDAESAQAKRSLQSYLSQELAMPLVPAAEDTDMADATSGAPPQPRRECFSEAHVEKKRRVEFPEALRRFASSAGPCAPWMSSSLHSSAQQQQYQQHQHQQLQQHDASSGNNLVPHFGALAYAHSVAARLQSGWESQTVLVPRRSSDAHA